MTTIIDTVIFDLGGVLIDWNPTHLYKKIFQDPEEMNYFLAEVCSPEWNEQQDGGRSLDEATTILLDEFPQYTDEIKAYYGRWTEMIGGAIDDTVTILKEIKAAETHRIYALTNWSAETFPVALERYDFLQLFEGILVSGDEKMKKPEHQIYNLILNRYKIHGPNAIFIDDNLRNIKASIECGIHGIHFTSPKQLRIDLKKYGILS
jgi:2-haloacid dehalogenase